MEHGDYLREVPHLRIRTNHFRSVFKLKSKVISLLRSYLIDRKFTEVHSPSLTFSDAEGGGQCFSIKNSEDYFGKETYLGVSAQLYLEAAAIALGRVFSFGPVYRAEKHHTSRHLSEFMMLEVEISFLQDIHELMDFCESMLMDCVTSLENYVPLVKRISPEDCFQRISYTEAIDLLRGCGVQFSLVPEWGNALQTEHEKYLADNIFKRPVFIYDYPKITKAFYMKNNITGDTVACFDLIFPGVGEIVGGSLREDNLDVLATKIKDSGLDESEYQWYLDLRRTGSVPHGGFGIGFERLCQFLLEASNIRDVTFIPRIPGSHIC